MSSYSRAWIEQTAPVWNMLFVMQRQKCRNLSRITQSNLKLLLKYVWLMLLLLMSIGQCKSRGQTQYLRDEKNISCLYSEDPQSHTGEGICTEVVRYWGQWSKRLHCFSQISLSIEPLLSDKDMPQAFSNHVALG